MIETIISYEFFIAMLAPVIFVIVYMPTPWRKTWEGRVIMLKELLWCGFLLSGVLYYAVGPDYPGRQAFKLLLFTTLMVSLWAMTVLLIVRQVQGRRLRSQALQEAHQTLEDHQLG